MAAAPPPQPTSAQGKATPAARAAAAAPKLQEAADPLAPSNLVVPSEVFSMASNKGKRVTVDQSLGDDISKLADLGAPGD